MKRQGPSRPGQKTFSLGTAREPFEAWCRRNGYDERTVFLCGWIALQRISHEDRIKLFLELEKAADRNFELEDDKAAIAAQSQSRPAEKTPSQGSRRAG